MSDTFTLLERVTGPLFRTTSEANLNEPGALVGTWLVSRSHSPKVGVDPVSGEVSGSQEHRQGRRIDTHTPEDSL